VQALRRIWMAVCKEYNSARYLESWEYGLWPEHMSMWE